MSSPSQNGSSSDVSMIEGDSAMLPEAWRLRATLGLSFLTVRPGVLILLGVTFGDGDGFEFGVRGFTGVVFGVAMTDVAS